MPHFVCTTCGTQHAESEQPPAKCAICEDERQYVKVTECDLDTSVPEWVIEHPETLAIFQELGIDYCCGGKSLEFACRERGLDAILVLSRIRRNIEAGSP